MEHFQASLSKCKKYWCRHIFLDLTDTCVHQRTLLDEKAITWNAFYNANILGVIVYEIYLFRFNKFPFYYIICGLVVPCFATYLGKLVVAYCLTTPSHCLNYLIYNLRSIYKSWCGHGGESDNATLVFLPAYHNIGIGTMWHYALVIYTPSPTICVRCSGIECHYVFIAMFMFTAIHLELHI